MTAEIAIMNKEAIALATDSAVTMTDKKIFTSANKLFALSKYFPVGIMVYGNALFMGVPWETIIKLYRSNLGRTSFETLNEYAKDFVSFLTRTPSKLFPEHVQDDYVASSIYSYFKYMLDEIEDRIGKLIKENDKVSEEETVTTVTAVIERHYRSWASAEASPSAPKNHASSIIRKYGNTISKARQDVFQKLPISRLSANHLRKIAANLFSRFPDNVDVQDVSGVVIAGFGEQDVFPSLKSFDMEGIANQTLKYRESFSSEIDYGMGASLIAFAQKEMVATFMEGVDPFCREVERAYLSQTFSKYAEAIVDSIDGYTVEQRETLKQKLMKINADILKDHDEMLKEHRKTTYTDPVTNVVSALPKDELAAVAESLVNLTSFKRRVTMESETVAGPIDVAVISKGDGFIWIKRKHYFKPELNPGFAANYYREVQP